MMWMQATMTFTNGEMVSIVALGIAIGALLNSCAYALIGR